MFKDGLGFCYDGLKQGIIYNAALSFSILLKFHH